MSLFIESHKDVTLPPGRTPILSVNRAEADCYENWQKLPTRARVERIPAADSRPDTNRGAFQATCFAKMFDSTILSPLPPTKVGDKPQLQT